jgi:hypothetical protein
MLVSKQKEVLIMKQTLIERKKTEYTNAKLTTLYRLFNEVLEYGEYDFERFTSLELEKRDAIMASNLESIIDAIGEVECAKCTSFEAYCENGRKADFKLTKLLLEEIQDVVLLADAEPPASPCLSAP